ncbi:hypothetical protein MRB53_014104 [Persea americana]|uniref:Uncharacterized protein n=1 Tax=Persea americana TaxID=3435 RepID=A0ACC2K9W3_PERAE|nr:hypothetical protein MRB53_014104 [Persea americana]
MINSSQNPFRLFQDRVFASSSFSDDQGDDKTRQPVFSCFCKAEAILFSEISTKPWPSFSPSLLVGEIPRSQIVEIHPSPSFCNPERGSSPLFFSVKLRPVESEPETHVSAAIQLAHS